MRLSTKTGQRVVRKNTGAALGAACSRAPRMPVVLFLSFELIFVVSDGGAAAAPKRKKKKSPAGRKSGNGMHDQRNVRRRAAADDSGA